MHYGPDQMGALALTLCIWVGQSHTLSSKTHNWFSLPGDKWDAKWSPYGALIRRGFLTTIYILDNKVGTCVVFFTTRSSEIDTWRM